MRAQFACLLLTLASVARADFVRPLPGVPDLPADLPDLILRPDNSLAYARAISSDGAVVAGSGYRYQLSTGLVELWPANAGAAALSADGRVVVGTTSNSPFLSRAFSGTASTDVQDLGLLPGTGLGISSAWGVSADGRVVVGSSTDPSAVGRPVRWTDAGIEALGDAPGFARAVSADGAVIVGTTGANGLVYRAFRWTAATGLVTLEGDGQLLPEQAQAVSPDGRFIVGDALRSTDGARRVFLDDGATLLDLGPASVRGPLGVAADGSRVVGGADRGALFDLVLGGGSVAGTEPFVWTADAGRQLLLEYLVARGATGLDGWQLWSLEAVSADGNWVLGQALAPNGARAVYLANLAAVPAPATAPLLLTAALALAARRRRRVG